MRRGQLLLLLGAVIAVAAIAVLSGRGAGRSEGTSAGAAHQRAPAGAVTVRFGYSPEKEQLLLPLIRRFNAQRLQIGGRPVFVEAQVISSGEAETKLAKGALQLDAWSPASSLWGRLLNFETDAAYVADENPSIVRTPLVIAMWEPMARALGWPAKQLGFDDLLRLTRDPSGWARYGRPEYGAFKLVHTNPDFSTSGLEAVAAEYYAASRKQEGLRTEDVERARATVKEIERSIVHYGDTTLFISDQLKAEGPGYASAVAMEEATLLDFNRTRGTRPKLVAIYPKEGTFYSDDPYITLRAPWVSAQRRRAAAVFQRFLAREVTPRAAADAGFRPGDLRRTPLPPITKANGVDPAQPTRALALPEPRVLDAIRRRWREDRKPASVLLVIDTSGSMGEEGRLEQAQRGLQAFLGQAAPQDRIGLTAFSDAVRGLVPIAPVAAQRPRLQEAARSLIADGGTKVWDATDNAVVDVQKLADAGRINAVVVLTDGEDTDSSLSADDLVRRLRAQGDSPRRVRVFTIAYSPGAAGSRDALERIAAASGAKAYQGDTSDIESVYRSISSFF